MSCFYDHCASAKFLLLFKEKVADGGTGTSKFIHIFRRRMTDKVLCSCGEIFTRNYFLNHLFRHQVADLTWQFESNHCHLMPPSPHKGEGMFPLFKVHKHYEKHIINH